MKWFTCVLFVLLTTYVIAQDYSDSSDNKRMVKVRKARRRRPNKSEEELKIERALFNVRVDKKPGINSYIIQNENSAQPIKPSKTTYYVNVTGTQERPFFGNPSTPSVTKEPSITILVAGESSAKPEDELLQSLLSRIQAIRDQKNQNSAGGQSDDEPILIEDLTDGAPKPVQFRSDTIISRRPVSYSGLLASERLTTQRPRPTTTEKTTTKRVTTQRKQVEVVADVIDDELDEDGFRPGTYVWVNNKKVLKEDFEVLSQMIPENELTKKTGEVDDSGEYYDYVYYYDDDGAPTTTTKRPLAALDRLVTTRRLPRPPVTAKPTSRISFPSKVVTTTPLRASVRQTLTFRPSTTQKPSTPRTPQLLFSTTTKNPTSTRKSPFVQSGYASVKNPPEQGTDENRVAQTSIILSPPNRQPTRPIITTTKESVSKTKEIPTTTAAVTTTTTSKTTTKTTTTTTAPSTTTTAPTTTTSTTTTTTTTAPPIEKRVGASEEMGESRPEELQKIVDTLIEKGAITPTSSTKKPVAMEDILKIAAGLIPIGSAALAAAYSQGKFGPKLTERLDADDDQPNFWSFLTGKRDRDDRTDHGERNERPETPERLGRPPLPYPNPADHMRMIERLERRPVVFDRDPILERIPIERGPIYDRPRPPIDQSFEPSRHRPVVVEHKTHNMQRVEKPKDTTERDVDIVTAPENFNMIVSSSLNADGNKTSPIRHHGYIVDGSESRELIQIPPPKVQPQVKVEPNLPKKPEVVMITAQDALANKPQELQSLVGLLAHIYTTSAPILGSPKAGERPFVPGGSPGVNIVPIGETGYTARQSEETERHSTARPTSHHSSDEKSNYESGSTEKNRSIEDIFLDFSREMSFDLTNLYSKDRSTGKSQERPLQKSPERHSEENHRGSSKERSGSHQTSPPERYGNSRERYPTSQERPGTHPFSRTPTTPVDSYSRNSPGRYDPYDLSDERFEDRSNENSHERVPDERTIGTTRDNVAMTSQRRYTSASPERQPSTPPIRTTLRQESSERVTATAKPDSHERRDLMSTKDVDIPRENFKEQVDGSNELSDEEKAIVEMNSVSSTVNRPTSKAPISSTPSPTAELTRATKKPKRKESYFDQTQYNKHSDSDESNLQTYYDAVPNDVRSKFGPNFVNEKPAVDFDENEEDYNEQQEEPQMNSLTTEQMVYLLIGSLCGFSLICLGLVFLTMRCRTRSMYSSPWCPCSDSMSDSMSDSLDSRSNRSTRTVISQKVQNQLQETKGGVGATHKLGTWFNGRNTIAVFDENGKPRNQMALPNFSSSVSKKSTKAYFTDGRSGSTRDLVAEGSTPPSPQGSDTSERAKKSREKKSGQGSSWLHKEYDEKAHASEATANLAHGLAYYKEKTDEVSDNERPRSSATTLKAPPHFRAAQESESESEIVAPLPTIEANKPKLQPKPKRASSPPPQLPPKKRDTLKTEDPVAAGSHLTLQTEASSHAADSMSVMSSVYGQGRMGYWTSVKDARIL